MGQHTKSTYVGKIPLPSIGILCHIMHFNILILAMPIFVGEFLYTTGNNYERKEEETSAYDCYIKYTCSKMSQVFAFYKIAILW